MVKIFDFYFSSFSNKSFSNKNMKTELDSLKYLKKL